MKTLLSSFLLLTIFACTSPAPIQERGWTGGEFAEVVREGGMFSPPPPAVVDGRLVGMPAAVPAECGLLLVDRPPGSPLARAGLVRGDLILAIGDEPVSNAAGFREAVESRAPGSTMRIRIWRQDRTRELVVRIGREAWQRQGWISVGLGISPRLDLWPFDDGFDLLGIVAFTRDDRRVELHTPGREWLERSHPGGEIPAPAHERTRFCLLPFSVSVGKVILAQEPR